MREYGIAENETVELHDCRTNHIRFADGVMTFEFPAGFCVLNGSEPRRTGKAEMQCRILDPDIDGISVFLYKKTPKGNVLRRDWSDLFLPAVNDGTYEFEFVTTYRSYQRMLFKGYVWFDTKPYHMECEIELHTDRIFYRWDE